MKRVLLGAMWVLIVALIVAVVLVAIPIFILCALIHLIEHAAKNAWHGLPRNRRALRLAQEAFEKCMPGYRIIGWQIPRRDRHKCFVMAALAGSAHQQSYWLAAVWDGEDRVDELGTWQFRWGIRLHHAVNIYETARSCGKAWPVGLTAAIEAMPPEQLPAEARQDSHPHEGPVLLRRGNDIQVFATAEWLAETMQSAEMRDVEAFDAECRRLRVEVRGENQIVVLAPFPPPRSDKLFVERLRHFLLSRNTDPQAQKNIRELTPTALADYALEMEGFHMDLD